MPDFLGLSAAVAHNLATADHAEGLPQAGAEAHGGAVAHVVPTLLGLPGYAWVSLAMVVFIAILLWKKVPGVIAGALDRQIADIRRQLDEAKALRAEAEGLRDSYARRIADAETAAGEMLSHAQGEADALIAKARIDADELVRRRAGMAQDKIAAAERVALAQVRAHAAEAAARAATALIAGKHDATADRALVDRTIAGLSRVN